MQQVRAQRGVVGRERSRRYAPLRTRLCLRWAIYTSICRTMKLSVKQIDRLFWAMWSKLIGWIACCWLDVPLCGYMRIRSWTGYAGAMAAVMAIIITLPDVVIQEGRDCLVKTEQHITLCVTCSQEV